VAINGNQWQSSDSHLAHAIKGGHQW